MKRVNLDLEMETRTWEHIDEFSAAQTAYGDNARELIDTSAAG